MCLPTINHTSRWLTVDEVTSPSSSWYVASGDGRLFVNPQAYPHALFAGITGWVVLGGSMTGPLLNAMCRVTIIGVGMSFAPWAARSVALQTADMAVAVFCVSSVEVGDVSRAVEVALRTVVVLTRGTVVVDTRLSTLPEQPLTHMATAVKRTVHVRPLTVDAIVRSPGNRDPPAVDGELRGDVLEAHGLRVARICRSVRMRNCVFSARLEIGPRHTPASANHS